VKMCCNDGKRPNEMTLILWRRIFPLVWDFTCSDTLAPSNLSTSSSGARRLGNSAGASKIKKYSIYPDHKFSFFSFLCGDL